MVGRDLDLGSRGRWFEAPRRHGYTGHLFAGFVLLMCEFQSVLIGTVKPVLSGHSKRRPEICFQDLFSLNEDQKYCRMLQESILQYFRPSLTYHLSLDLCFAYF